MADLSLSTVDRQLDRVRLCLARFDAGELGIGDLAQVLHVAAGILAKQCRCDDPTSCCPVADHRHVTPHRGCMLR